MHEQFHVPACSNCIQNELNQNDNKVNKVTKCLRDLAYELRLNHWYVLLYNFR